MNPNCFCSVVGPITSVRSGEKNGKKWCSVNLSCRVYTGVKGNPYSTVLFSFPLFDKAADLFLSSCQKGDFVCAMGTPMVGKAFNTNKGDTINPIDLKNVQWGMCSMKKFSDSENETPDANPWEE